MLTGWSMIMLMAKNRRTYDSYPRDAFDNPPRGPVGVHRGSRSVAARLVPYLVVIVVATLAGVLVWSIFSGGLSRILPWSRDASSVAETSATSGAASSSAQDSAGSGTSSDASDSAGSSDASSSQSSSSSPSSSSPSSTSAADVNKATVVRIVNATQINGYAASKAAILRQAGYTNVSAANPTGQVPSSTVVWYENASDAATAQEVATELGITSVRQVSGIAAPVTVVLLD